MKTRTQAALRPKGFALVATLSLMVLLAVLAVGLLSLSAVTLRSSSQGNAQAEARANARMALMLAIGELQKEMGPDMRISAESAILDSSEQTEKIDGVAQSRWLGSYDSWGTWLNASYTRPGAGSPLNIQDTYSKGRANMFRRWLLSLPPGMEKDNTAPILPTGWNDENSVVLVGKGSHGIDEKNPKQEDELDKITRAYLVKVGSKGKHAWWVGAENQRAKASLAKNQRSLAAADWETSQGDTAEVGVGALDGLIFLDNAANLSERLVSNSTLEAAGAAKDVAHNHFFDVTTHGKGVVTSVRSGQLKKDLSLLFEKPNGSLPTQYKFNTADIREPSIRPMSPELRNRAVMPNRQFASWTNMRHFYRMYRSASDATVTEQGIAGNLSWKSNKPSADYATSSSVKIANPPWNGSNHYWRAPILAKLTLVYSLVAKPVAGDKFECLQYYSPVFTFWNPYNTQLTVPSGKMSISSKAYRMWPTNTKFYLNGIYKTMNGYAEAKNFTTFLTSGGSGDIVFQPGELKVFSMKNTLDSSVAGGLTADLVPGFDPSVVVGDERKWSFKTGSVTSSTFSEADRPGAAYEFSCAQWGGGVNMGNTPGAMFLESRMAGGSGELPMTYSNDWFQRAPHVRDQTNTPITPSGSGNLATWAFDGNPKIVAYAQMAIKGLFDYDYPSIDWKKDWRTRNWIQSPPFYFGSGMYMSLDDTISHTQRLDCPYIVNFGPTTTFGISKIIGQIGDKAFLGPAEQVTSAAMLELPSAPISSLAGFSNMRINPGWLRADQLSPNFIGGFSGNGSSVAKCSLYAAESKRVAYQSGVTGPGLGNSFMHPMLPRNDVYRFIENSISRDVIDRTKPDVTEEVNTKAYCDYWDHVFLLNDALWDDYFVSSLADQKRGSIGSASSLDDNLDRLTNNQPLPNSRYVRCANGQTSAAVKTELEGEDGYLKAARHLMVDGMFNVNSTSVDAWYALFAGIRERKAVYRDASGNLKEIEVPADKRIVLTRFNTEVSDKEMVNATSGVTMPDGSKGWSGVRFLDDDELKSLARECVKQVKLRGPFLNFSEFINRRLSNDKLGLMGALQSAIDYDDAAPEPGSINFRYKNTPTLRITQSDLGVAATGDVAKRFSTPEAVEGSRLAGIPGYVIQSDLLKPIANTLSVRDDTFLIRAYGESLDAKGNVIARAWCEATVQRMPEYQDPSNSAETPAREIDNDGAFKDSGKLSAENLRFGRRFVIESFRWLNKNEV